jgi:predicted HTH transcriptional regulator
VFWASNRTDLRDLYGPFAMGVVDVLKEDDRLANLIADIVSPKLVPSIEVIAWRKADVQGVEIYPSSNRPHHLNRLGPGQGGFIRAGSTIRRLSSTVRYRRLRE